MFTLLKNIFILHFCSPLCMNRFWDPPSFLKDGYREIIKGTGHEADRSFPCSTDVYMSSRNGVLLNKLATYPIP
jgi:hypothetical protein